MSNKAVFLPDTLTGAGLIEALKGLTDKVDWIAEGFMADPSITMIYGTDGIGKSLAGLQMAMELASASPVFGVFPVGNERKVVYVVAERSIKEPLRRIRTILENEYMNKEKLSGNFTITTAFQGRDISNRVISELLIARLRAMGEELGGLNVVFFDPLYALVKGDLKTDEAINGVFDFFRRVGNELGASVVFVHHENRGHRGEDGLRSGQDFYGNKFISGLCTSIYHMTRASNEELRTILTNEKDTERALVPRIELEYHPEIGIVRACTSNAPAVREFRIKDFLRKCQESGKTFQSDELFDFIGQNIHAVTKRKIIAELAKAGRIKNTAPTGTKGLYMVRAL